MYLPCLLNVYFIVTKAVISRHDQDPLSVKQSINRIMSLPLKTFREVYFTASTNYDGLDFHLKGFKL